MLLGIHHEQQHQELILTDLKHAWASNPLHPVYREALPDDGTPPRHSWLAFPAGLAWIGHDGDGFAFDNESPRHRTWLHGFQLASRLVTNAEYLAFVNDGGYDRPELWLSDGWAARQAQGCASPALLGEAGRRVVHDHAGGAATLSVRTSRFVTSATTKPTLLPAGPAPDCPPRRSGK